MSIITDEANTVSSLAYSVRTTLLPHAEVSRVASIRRSTSLFSQGQVADSLYFVDDGLIKLTRTNDGGNRIILSICGPGELVGEEVLAEDAPVYQGDAEALTTASLYRIPRDTLIGMLRTNFDFAAALIDYLVHRKSALARKVELLCLHDVEFRILHYLVELSSLVRPVINGEGYELPITQAELADLIGATRETTSTTLNQLERKGLVKLSRRLLTVPSPSTLQSVAIAKQTAPQAIASGA
ncbi:MAG: Crp/Fnr family transcriptional regulator [Bryobacteraceae bacterium]